MFKNLFKKVDEVELSINEPKNAIDSTVIKKDLNTQFGLALAEFDLIGAKQNRIEKLMLEKEVFKQSNKGIYEKIEKLKSFGFINTPSAKNSLEKLKVEEARYNDRIKDIEKEIKNVERISRLNAEYAIKYPGYKFIDFDTMVKIMKKYSLFMGETFMYGREIPDRALGLIGNFSSEIEQSKEVYDLIKNIGRYSYTRHRLDIRKSIKKEIESGIVVFDSMILTKREIVEKRFEFTSLKMVAPLSHFEHIEIEMFDGEDYVKVPLVKQNPLTNILELSTEKVNEVEKRRIEILDPIACLKVDGGFIVIDAWDKEAEIPEIKNPLSN